MVKWLKRRAIIRRQGYPVGQKVWSKFRSKDESKAEILVSKLRREYKKLTVRRSGQGCASSSVHRPASSFSHLPPCFVARSFLRARCRGQSSALWYSRQVLHISFQSLVCVQARVECFSAPRPATSKGEAHKERSLGLRLVSRSRSGLCANCLLTRVAPRGRRTG